VALAYTLAGCCHALILTALFVSRYWDIFQRKGAEFSLMMTSLAAVTFCTPVLITLLHFSSMSRVKQVLWTVAAVVVVFLASGTLSEVGMVLFQFHLVIPLALFLVLSLRFWRGVAPLTMAMMTPVAFAAVIGVYLWSAAEGTSDSVWVGRLLGIGVGAGVGYLTLLAISHARDTAFCSDEEIFLDCWWFLFTIYQTTLWARNDPVYLLTLASFPVYLLIKRLLLRLLLRAQPEHDVPNILLLRVFGFDHRTERLFDHLALRWRQAGPISLIMGLDIAARSIVPADFAAFLVGRLRCRFVQVPSTLVSYLRRPVRAPDGLYPVNQLMSMADTWQPVMRALEGSSYAVVMDLRGFTADNHGCRVELNHLATKAPNKPVVLIVDRTSDAQLIYEIIAAARPLELSSLPQSWCLIEGTQDSALNANRALAHVAQHIGAPS
jgi:hypothetical protein